MSKHLMNKIAGAVNKAVTEKKDLQKQPPKGEIPSPQKEVINPQSGMGETNCPHCGKGMPGSKNKSRLE